MLTLSLGPSKANPDGSRRPGCSEGGGDVGQEGGRGIGCRKPCSERALRALSLCLQAVPPGPGGRAPESDLARPTASAADCPEAALLPRGLQAGSRTPGGGAGCPELSQGKGV